MMRWLVFMSLIKTDIVERSAISDELEVLSLLIQEYELKHHPVSYRGKEN